MRDSANLRRWFIVLFKYKKSIIFIWLITILTVMAGNQMTIPIYQVESTIMVNFGREYLYNPEVGNDKPYNYFNRSGVINSEIEILKSVDLIDDIIDEIGLEKIYPQESSKEGSLETVKNFFQQHVIDIDTYSEKITRALDDILWEWGLKTTIDLSQRNMTPEKSEAIKKFYENLTVLGSKDTKIIRVIFEHHDPVIAAESVNLLIERYQRKHLDMLRDQRVSDFLEKMVKQYEADLREAEDDLLSYKNERVENSVERQQSVLVDQKGAFDTKLKEQQSELVGLNKRLESLENQRASMDQTTALFSETTEQNPVIENAKEKLLTLKLKEQELLGTFRETSQQVVNIRESIKIVESFLRDQEANNRPTVRVGKSMAYQELERDITITKARKQELAATIEDLEKKNLEIEEALKNYISGEQDLRLLQRQKDIKESDYFMYKKKLDEAKINTEMDNLVLTNIKIVHKAEAPYEPIKPKKGLNLMIGVLFGGLAGIGISFLRNSFNQGLNTPEDLENRLNIPVLITIRENNNLRRSI